MIGLLNKSVDLIGIPEFFLSKKKYFSQNVPKQIANSTKTLVWNPQVTLTPETKEIDESLCAVFSCIEIAKFCSTFYEKREIFANFNSKFDQSLCSVYRALKVWSSCKSAQSLFIIISALRLFPVVTNCHYTCTIFIIVNSNNSVYK